MNIRAEESENPYALSDRERRLFLEACTWYKRYDDSNPDVGMGPGCFTIVDRVATRVKIDLTDTDRRWLEEEVKKREFRSSY